MDFVEGNIDCGGVINAKVIFTYGVWAITSATKTVQLENNTVLPRRYLSLAIMYAVLYL